jgi:8-oxo-dGTP pyrophosphatase MutT (NUDIX family)
MAYVGSYLWRLRQVVGSELVLMPGAMVALLDQDERVLMTKRADDGTWCLPAGAAEPGGSFARTAIDELAEETGIEVRMQDLVPFASLSEADLHTIEYPSGDRTHCFALLFLARSWAGELEFAGDEVLEGVFVGLDSPPAPLHAPTGLALDLLREFLASGQFQLR